MKKTLVLPCLPVLLGLAACSPHIDPATSTPRAVLFIFPMTDDIHSAVAFVEDRPGSGQTTFSQGRLDDNHVEFFPKKARTVTYLLNGQPIHDPEAIQSYLRQHTSASIKLIENAARTHRTFILKDGN